MDQNLRQNLLKQNLHVNISSPDTTYFLGEAKAISMLNDNGPFDVLPGHENFISIIKKNITIYDLSKQKKEIPIVSAVIKVFQNKVDIFIGVETLTENTQKTKMQELLDI